MVKQKPVIIMRHAWLGSCLYGLVFGHPHNPDATWVWTTRVIRRISDDCYETRNSIYRIEDWAPSSEKIEKAMGKEVPVI